MNKPREFHGIPEDEVREIARWALDVTDPSWITIAVYAAREQVARWDVKDACLLRPGDIVTHPDWEGEPHTVVSVGKDEGIVELLWGDQTKSTWWPADQLTLVERPDQ